MAAQTTKESISDTVRYWTASFLRYLELKLQLLGIESKEAGMHLLVLLVLCAVILVSVIGCLVMLVVFVLYLITLLFHWDWGWSALLCAVILLIIGAVSAFILRSKINHPIYPVTFAELKKDREWLTKKTRNVA